MLNELEEFRAYTQFPVYAAKGKRDTSYLGRFTYEILTVFHGLGRILTILARGYLWMDGEADIPRAKRALLARCSLPETKKASPKEDWQYKIQPYLAECAARGRHPAGPEAQRSLQIFGSRKLSLR